MPVLQGKFWLGVTGNWLLGPVLSFALFNKYSQENQVGYPSKYDLKSNIHQEICQKMMWVGEDIYPGVHSEPLFLDLGHRQKKVLVETRPLERQALLAC